ncbi:cytochrome P450 [Nocardia sp. NPDC046763]|uniref:cytochrome P450 n=1 Tax=unclassified Nocardia TaxID=2637762 RepID=UPI0033EADFB8
MMQVVSTIPDAPGALPLLGHTVQLVRRPLSFVESLAAHGDLVRIRIGPVSAVVVSDPRVLDRLLHDDRVFDKGGPFFDRAREVVGDSLPVCPHSAHRRLRRLAQPSFHKSRLPGYAEIMTNQITAVVERWRDGQVLDVLRETTTIASNTLVATMFSESLPPEVLQRMLTDLAVIVNGIYQRVIVPRRLAGLNLLGTWRYERASRRLREDMSVIIAARRGDGRDHGDLLSALLDADDPDSDRPRLGDEEIIGQLLSFFWAGTETTGSTVAWALHMLAHYPEVERRLFEEVDAVLGGRAATYADLAQLELTGRIITETMRLWPSAWLLTRTTTVDTVLAGHEIAAGTTIVFGAYLIHRHPDQLRVDRFDPDRWLPGNAAPQRISYVPFGSGARKCMGDVFSQTEATLMLATIAARWRLSHVADAHVRPKATAILSPSGLRMLASARTSYQQ